MDKFEGCVLLTRVGGFYELYFEHAEEYAPLLNIKLVRKKTTAGHVPMVSPTPWPLLPHSICLYLD
jgi:DNA mismatch repair ATPase MutS